MENTTFVSLDDDLICNHLHGEKGVTQKIKKAMYDAAKEFVYIGFLLWEVKEYEYYYEGSYESVYEYAEAELGFKRSSTKNFIAIAETFGTVKKGMDTTHTMSLQKEYSDYNYSQLTEMLAMTPAQREKANPSMTIRDLRSLKQKDREEAIKNTPPPASYTRELQTGQTSGQSIRWIPYNGRSPQKGKWPCKLVVHIVYLDGKPRENIDFGFYRNGKWENRQGREIIDVKHYSEIPDLPGRYPPLAYPTSR